MLIKRLFSLSSTRGEHPTDYASLPGGGSSGLELEYQKVIASQLRRLGVPESCASVEVRSLGQSKDARDVLVGLIRLTAWDRKPAIRLLLGMPLLESKVRKAIAALWLADVSHFAGLWLHASGELQAGPAVAELRQLIVGLTGPRAQAGLRADRHDPSRPSRL